MKFIERKMNHIKKKINTSKSKRGMSTIEFVIGLFIFIILFSFLFDLFLVSYRNYAVSNEATKLIRVLSNQSGIKRFSEPNFPGGDEAYLTVNEMYDRINRKLTSLGISDDEWKAIIRVKNKKASTSTKEIKRTYVLKKDTAGIVSDYRDYIELEIQYNYKWSIWSQFLPTEIEGSNDVVRYGFSEYKADYATWEGEE